MAKIDFAPEDLNTIKINQYPKSAVEQLFLDVANSQEKLVSGVNIKTISGQSILGSGDIPVSGGGGGVASVNGYTGTVVLTKSDLSLANVDNTSDINKPISTAVQTALNAKQNTITNSDSITQGATNLFLTTSERTKLTNTSGTNTGDNAINSLYSGLVSNATHTGDVAGATGLTAQPAIITGKPSATVASGDLLLIADISDSNNLKQITAQSIANLGGGGGAVSSVNGQTGVVVLNADNIDDTSTAHKFVTSSDLTKLSNLSGTNTGDNATNTQYSGLASSKQDTLVSGTNIRTINSTTLLGSGNIALEPTVTAGTLSQYYRGDKTFQTLDKAAVGLTNVDNTSDSTKNSATATLTNKRITARTGTTASSATPTINTDNVDFYSITALAVNITSFTTNLSGTPTDNQKLWIAITGTATRTITWGTSFEASTVLLPTTTNGTNRLDIGFVWNVATSRWRCIAVA